MRKQRRKAESFVLLPALLAGMGWIAIPSTPAIADGNQLTNASITDAVEDEFLFDRGVPFNDIDVHVSDGVVTLAGTVNNLLAKKRATRLAETVKGVRAVVNKIEVAPAKKRSASALKRDVEAALLADPATESYELRVDATDAGKVTLRGTADSWQEYHLAEKVAMSVAGVTDVVNDIDVAYESGRSDAEIRGEIESALGWDTLVDHALIRVQVNDGAVALSGTVGSAAEKRRAKLDAWVAGVASVDVSDLAVAKWARDPELRKNKYVAKSDEKIRHAVKDALFYDPRVTSFNVEPEVENGVVTLRGTVDNLKATRAAAADARHTVGVISVKNRLKVRPPVELADDAIATAIEAALGRDPYVERFKIDVDVRDGVAYLQGTVGSDFEKARADEVASSVVGVTDVRNGLRVPSPRTAIVYDPYVDDWYTPAFQWNVYHPTFPRKSDKQIAEDIHDELWWSPYVDADEVTVRVEDGTATLTGEVDSWAERRAAEENAYEGGAIGVYNRLTVQ